MKVRSARPEDLDELVRLKRAAGYPGSVFLAEEDYFQASRQRLADCLPRLADLPDWRCLVLTDDEAVAGYLLFVVDDEHGVTHQLQAVTLDYAVLSFDGLAALVARGRKIVHAFENEYLLADLPPGDKRLQLWFYRCGFRAEQNRSVRRFPRGHRGASSPDFRMRPARADDIGFILEVHREFTAAYRPAGRETDLATVELRYQLLYAGLELKSSSHFIMEEAASGRAVGYIFVQAGPDYAGTPSLYVYDVAISPAFAGRGLSRYMIGHAETLAGERGALLYGDASLATPLLANWHTQLGYTVDSVRYALDCRG